MTSREHRGQPKAGALEFADAAEAEAAAAEAEARASAARARAKSLRQQAEAASSELCDPGETSNTTSSRRQSLRSLGIRGVAVVGAIIGICVSLAASGYMAWHSHTASQQRQRVAEYSAAARRDVAAFMALDFNKTKEDLQLIEDNSTGKLKGSLPTLKDQLTKRLQQAKVVTTATVNDVAVESMTDDSAMILVAATTEATGPDGQPQPRVWHIALGLRRDGGKPKMSSIEFVQ